MRSAHAIGFSLLLASLCPIFSQAADVFWTNPAGGNWSDTNNWSGGVLPVLADNVFIVADGTYTVALNVNATIHALTLGGTNGIQSLTNGNSTLTVTTVGSIRTNGVLKIGAGSI